SFVLLPPPPASPLFPYTTLFRSAVLTLTFTDPDLTDTHTIEIDWQDGTTDTFSLAAGVTSFSTSHTYLDDHLQSPLTEEYDVKRSEEHTSELQSRENLVCRLLLE